MLRRRLKTEKSIQIHLAKVGNIIEAKGWKARLESKARQQILRPAQEVELPLTLAILPNHPLDDSRNLIVAQFQYVVS